jgi:hypothetical protein
LEPAGNGGISRSLADTTAERRTPIGRAQPAGRSSGDHGVQGVPDLDGLIGREVPWVANQHLTIVSYRDLQAQDVTGSVVLALVVGATVYRRRLAHFALSYFDREIRVRDLDRRAA